MIVIHEKGDHLDHTEYTIQSLNPDFNDTEAVNVSDLTYFQAL